MDVVMGTEAEGVALRERDWRERALAAEARLTAWLEAPPAHMSSPLGLVPVNSEGMRRLVDALASALATIEAIRRQVAP